MVMCKILRDLRKTIDSFWGTNTHMAQVFSHTLLRIIRECSFTHIFSDEASIQKDRWSLVSLCTLNKEIVIWNAGKRGWESKVDIVVAGQTLVSKEILFSLGL